MKPKAILKIGMDVLMTLGLLFLMGYQFWGDAAHEWAGAGMFLLWIVHHILNASWYSSLFRGKYTPVRIFQLVIDLLVFLCMIGLMVSGVLLSRHVFPLRGWMFHGFHGGMSFARLLHLAASHWGFVLMALHLGLHWGMFLGMAKKALKLKQPSPLGRILLPILGAGIAVYGLTVFFRRDFLTYLLMRAQFVFLDYGEAIPLFYLDYLAMMETFIFLSYYLTKMLKAAAKRKALKKPPETKQPEQQR